MKYGDDLETSERCKAKRNGVQCKNRHMIGLEVCHFHGGATRLAKAKSAKAKLVTKMQDFATPISADHELNDPIAGFEHEYRRTMGRILWYDEQLSALSVEQLTWGKTKKEEIGATEFAGENTTYEARANMLHELQFRERQHLVNMQKIWIGAKLDESKLQIQRSYVTMLDSAMTDILTALGHDTNDPATRQIVRDRLLALPMRGTPE